MKVYLSNQPHLIYENTTKDVHGFKLFNHLVKRELPFIEKIEYVNYTKDGDLYVVHVNVFGNIENICEYYEIDENSMRAIDYLENDLMAIYDSLPKNLRYSYPDNHSRFPGEGAGIIVDEIIPYEK